VGEIKMPTAFLSECMNGETLGETYRIILK
jgi:hypothetical protein